jgi:hypothetical protein
MRNQAKQIVACAAKVPFESRGDAMIFADRRRLPYRSYHCPMCGDWHLTSKREGYEASNP